MCIISVCVCMDNNSSVNLYIIANKNKKRNKNTIYLKRTLSHVFLMYKQMKYMCVNVKEDLFFLSFQKTFTSLALIYTHTCTTRTDIKVKIKVRICVYKNAEKKIKINKHDS